MYLCYTVRANDIHILCNTCKRSVILIMDKVVHLWLQVTHINIFASEVRNEIVQALDKLVLNSKNANATHVVVEIISGANAVFSFSSSEIGF